MAHQLTGRGHHKKRRKGARSNFTRRKNDELIRQKENSEKRASTSVTVPSSRQPLLPVTNTLEGSATDLEALKRHIILPANWQCFVESDTLEYIQLDKDEDKNRCVTKSVKIQRDLTWQVKYRTHVVPSSSLVLAKYPPHLILDESSLNLVKEIEASVLCPGHPEQWFVSACRERGGVMKGQRGRGDVVAYVDPIQVVDTTGKEFLSTVRRTDCDVLCEKDGSYPKRCSSCQSYRSALRSIVSRGNKQQCMRNSEDGTSPSSSTPYDRLSSSAKEERLKNLHQLVRSTKLKVRRLENKLTELIERDGVQLQENDATDVTALFDEVSPMVEEKFPKDSPQRILWDQQRQYYQLSNKKQMRWHPLIIRFALNLKYLSSSSYRAVRQSGFLSLPSERTLSDYTHWSSAHHGVQLEFIEHFKAMAESEVKAPLQKVVALSMDEMKIKSGLVFSKRSGNLVGFVDLGSANKDIEQLAAEPEPSLPELADQMFVVMARSVFKPSLSVPIAHYPSSKLSGTSISEYPILEHVLYILYYYMCGGSRAVSVTNHLLLGMHDMYGRLGSWIQSLSQVMALSKIFFVIGWILLTYTPFTIVALTVRSSDLEDGGFVCPGVPITLNCTTVGSQGIAWRSQQYIGDLDELLISNFRPLFYNVTSTSVNTTVATLTRNENGILESTLRIIPTLNHLTSSVFCVHTDSDNSTLPFTVRVITVPATPPEMISNQTMDRMDNCVVHLAWKPPVNIDSSDLSHYMIHIDGDNVMNKTHTVTNTSSLQQFAYPLCTCGDHTVSIQAVSRCGRAGSKTGSVRVAPSLLSPLTCDAQTTQPIPTTQSDEIINLRKEVKSYKSDLIGTTIFLCLVIIVLGGFSITFVVLYARALCSIKQHKNEKKNEHKNAFELAKNDGVEMDQKSTITEKK